MQRLTIITERGYIELGFNGVDSFFRSFNNRSSGIDALQKIDDRFLKILHGMKTHDEGFTEDCKIEFLKLFENQEHKFCLLTNDWALTKEKHEFLLRILNLCNKGYTLNEAVQSI